MQATLKAKGCNPQLQNTGASVDYYKVRITAPTGGGDVYTAECNDIIEALGMNYAEANVFKAMWRSCAARKLGVMKANYDGPVYDAEKALFFAKRVLVQRKGTAE